MATASNGSDVSIVDREVKNRHFRFRIDRSEPTSWTLAALKRKE
jgi:hypothetical protein